MYWYNYHKIKSIRVESNTQQKEKEKQEKKKRHAPLRPIFYIQYHVAQLSGSVKPTHHGDTVLLGRVSRHASISRMRNDVQNTREEMQTNAFRWFRWVWKLGRHSESWFTAWLDMAQRPSIYLHGHRACNATTALIAWKTRDPLPHTLRTHGTGDLLAAAPRMVSTACLIVHPGCIT